MKKGEKGMAKECAKPNLVHQHWILNSDSWICISNTESLTGSLVCDFHLLYFQLCSILWWCPFLKAEGWKSGLDCFYEQWNESFLKVSITNALIHSHVWSDTLYRSLNSLSHLSQEGSRCQDLKAHYLNSLLVKLTPDWYWRLMCRTLDLILE